MAPTTHLFALTVTGCDETAANLVMSEAVDAGKDVAPDVDIQWRELTEPAIIDRRSVNDYLIETFDDEHERERSAERMRLILSVFYDESDEEPEQALSDLLADLLHEADRRSIDPEDLFEDSWRKRTLESAEWGA